MKKQTRISVIVPVYQVEPYLRRCVDSILEQSYENMEIVLVDDGSTDGCGRICDEYAQKDSRITVLHKENGGLSDARNVALERIRGEFVTFIDSDDYVSRHYIAHLWEAVAASGADIGICGMIQVFGRGEVPDLEDPGILKPTVFLPEQCLEKMLYQDEIETCACGKLYRTSLFQEIRYPKGKLYEDLPVTHKIIERAGKIVLISNRDYCYFQRDKSIQHQSFSIRKMDAVEHAKAMLEHIRTVYPALEKAAKCRCFSATCNILFQIDDPVRFSREKDTCWQILKSLRCTVLWDSAARKKARIAACLSYLGYGPMKRIYALTKLRT